MDKNIKTMLLCAHMLAGGKVMVKDKHDHTVKESRITALYSDFTITLSDTVHSDYKIKDVTILPL